MTEVVVEALVKRFGAVRAVDGVSFTVAAGGILTLLGPSGCGKTTILRSIAGLESPDEGRIAIGGQDVFAGGRILVPAESRNLGMMFQAYAIWPHMTVFDNVAFGLKVRGLGRAETRARVEEALALVRLAGYDARYPSQLSGGQQQRVVLARCLAYRPALLLLDEPLANLDAKLREEMRIELRRIQRETGTTMIAVTHDQAEALALSDRIIVMDAGRIVQEGAPEEIWRHPAAPFVADFLGKMTPLQGRAAGGRIRIEGVGELLAPSPEGPVQVCLRPHAASLGPAGESGDNRWPGVVENAIFLGHHAECQVRVGSALLTLTAARAPAPGTAVSVSIDPGELIVFASAA